MLLRTMNKSRNFRTIGTIDMRDVAPTLAHEVGLALPSADGKVLLP